MMLEQTLERFAKFKYIGLFSLLFSTLGSAAMYFKEEVKLLVKDREAKVEISTSTGKIELNKNVNIEARVDSLGRDELLPGTLSIEANPEYLSIKPSRIVEIKSTQGSQSITSLPEITAIKKPKGLVKISAKFVSGDVTAFSNDLYIEIIDPIYIARPHFDRSDTGRINLTGEWNIDLNGVPGTMNIRQGTDNKIYGTYSIPGGKWPSGNVSGHKDGKTFRAYFSVPGKEANEAIRVAGYFEISSSNGDYIEVEGCAYHLKTSENVYDDPGTEGVECKVNAVRYDFKKVVGAARFHAISPFDKQGND